MTEEKKKERTDEERKADLLEFLYTWLHQENPIPVLHIATPELGLVSLYVVHHGPLEKLEENIQAELNSIKSRFN